MSEPSRLAKLFARTLDLIHPSYCELCQDPLHSGHSLCPPCADTLPRVTAPFCENCGETFDGNIESSFQCANCHGVTHDFDFAKAPLRGLETSFSLIHLLKYRRQFHLARDLAALMAETLADDERFAEFTHPVLVPVPLYWRRHQWRHGNQAYELARGITQVSGHPTLDALRRIRATSTQTKLSRRQRLTNLRGAFQIRPRFLKPLKAAHVILIDDVFTTGATAHECARILKKEGGAGRVAVLTLVRG